MKAVLQRVDPREFRMLLIGAAAIVCTAAAAAFVLPTAKAYRAASAQLATLQAGALDGDRLSRDIADREHAIAAMERNLYGDMADLPVRQVEAYVIGQLQNVSWSNGVELVSVEPSSGERVQAFQEILFRVRLVGHYAELYRWLWDARQQLGYVVIRDYGLSRHDDEDREPLLAAELTLASYRAIR